MLLFKRKFGKFDGTWHHWFAWWPVWGDEGILWLETVERRWEREFIHEASWWRYRRLK